MNKFAKLIVCNSYYNLFPILCKELGSTKNEISARKLVFCEDKHSLMTERQICAAFKGSFNIDVCSFSHYLHSKKTFNNVLSKEGSAMVVKKLLSTADLKCFNTSKSNLAPVLFDLFIQLKSACVQPEQLVLASEQSDGVLKNKLTDIALLFSLYEQYLKDNNLLDQNSVLSFVPDIISQDESIKNTDIILLGYNSFTKQARDIINSLLLNAKSVTAILVGGTNEFAFLNETISIFEKLCKQNKIQVQKNTIATNYSAESSLICNNLFNPCVKQGQKLNCSNIYFSAENSPYSEAETVATIIKQKVVKENLRYKDFTIILPDALSYEDCIKKAFSLLNVPYFLDQKKKVDNNPLVSLILAYIDVFRKGVNLSTFLAFCKNPLFSQDKNFNDNLENYLYKYNINYERLLTPFTFATENPQNLTEFEEFRQKACCLFENFNIKNMLSVLNVEQKLENYSKQLTDLNQIVDSAVNSQIYKAITSILTEIEVILGNSPLNYSEFKNIFLSGINALELSIIPQFNDAVFIGGFKEASLVNNKNLFVMGLTSSVPAIKEDIALLSDNDINALSKIKVLVEPQIKVVNHRAREETVLGLCAFENDLYLSYPITDISGTKTSKSEIISFIENTFTLLPFPELDKYISLEKAKRNFAFSCGKFAQAGLDDFSLPTAFYNVSKNSNKDFDTVKNILEKSNSEIKVKLDKNQQILLKDITSATTLESYYTCPYKTFLRNSLKAYPREKGEVDGLSVGNLVHEILKLFIEQLTNNYNEQTSVALFENCANNVLSKKEYAKFLTDHSCKATITFALEEARDFCLTMFKWLNQSRFVTNSTLLEASFGDGKGCKYPAVKLLNGKVKLSGKIDRIDVYSDYCRVIDYKTGTADDADDKLFSGRKLQLYLYGSAINDKQLAGAYYLKIKGGYLDAQSQEKSLAVGKTLDNQEVIFAQDSQLEQKGYSNYLPVKISGNKLKGVVSQEQMNAYINYAKKVSEKAAKQLFDGVIVSSPYEKVCQNCEYSALCAKEHVLERKVTKVDEQIIKEAVQDDCKESDL